MAKKISRESLIALITVIIVILLSLFLFNKNDNQTANDEPIPGINQTKTSKVDGTSIAYSANWQELPITDSDKKANVILKLGNTKPPGSFVWRSLKGKLDKSVNVSTLPNQIATEVTNGIDGSIILSKGVAKVGKFDAVKIVFTQPISQEPIKKYKSIKYVVPRPNQTHYLTFTAVESDFDRLEPSFAKILNSFIAYTTAHP